jgi:hypothetical protein
MKNHHKTYIDVEYAYIDQTQEIWFIDYIIGIAFIASIDFREGLLKSGRPYREFSDIKDFQDFMDEIFVHEIDIELSVDPITKEEQHYSKRIIRCRKRKPS